MQWSRSNISSLNDACTEDPPLSPKSSLQERFGKMLRISTSRVFETPIEAARRRTGSGASPKIAGSSSIKQVTDYKAFYTLGREVMPSHRSYTKIHFATRKSDGAEVVVKLRLKQNSFRTKEDEKNWRQSIQYWLNMPDSDNIVKIYEVLEDPRAFCIAMEKASGVDLCETLKQGSLPVPDARMIVQQLLAAMAHLHGYSMVHKDVKLENVVIDPTPTSTTSNSSGSSLSPSSVKVIDFDTLEQWSPKLPASKDVVGTDQYIAQEAYAGKYSPLSDVFAVGVIAYKLLCGKFPFHNDLFDDEAGENWVGSPQMAKIRERLKCAKVDFGHPVFLQNPLACDLVSRMLAHNEESRPAAANALGDPWFHEDVLSPKSKAMSMRAFIDAQKPFKDFDDESAVVAEESNVGEGYRQALLRGDSTPGSRGSPPRWILA